MSFETGLNPNITRVRKIWHEYLSNILASGHGSVTEHASWTFAIEGVSRVFTGEMNRHRVGVAISEGSMRFIRFDDIGFWMPTSLARGNQTLRLGSLSDEDFEDKKTKTRQIFESGFREMEYNYKQMCSIWGIEDLKDFGIKKKLTSLFRRLIGMGVATGGTWTMNVRALRHILAMRTSPHAEEEIALVMGMIGKWIVESEPDLFGDFALDASTGAWIPKNAKI
jgi:thymidylate synthase (FAD)